MRIKFTPSYWDHYLKIPWLEHRFLVQHVLETHPTPTTTLTHSFLRRSSSFFSRFGNSSSTQFRIKKPFYTLTSLQRTFLKHLIQSRQTSKPLQYVLGWTPFINLNLKTLPPCLIPRNDTEHWTHELILKYQSVSSLKVSPPRWIMEIGCGSGCIGLALLSHFPSSQLIAYDCQREAIQLAQWNAQQHQCLDRCQFHLANVFDRLQRKNESQNQQQQQQQHPKERHRLSQSFLPSMSASSMDLLVSNPPYLSKKEWQELPKEVKHWEDPIALIGGESGIEWYPLLFQLAHYVLSPTFSKSISVPCFAVEIGHDQGPLLEKMALQHFHKVELGQDLAGRNRYIFGYGLKRS